MVSAWGRERNASGLLFVVFLMFVLALWLLTAFHGPAAARLGVCLFLFLLFPGLIPALLLRARLGFSLLEALPLAVSFSLGQAALLLVLFDRSPLSLLDTGWALVALALCWHVWAALKPAGVPRIRFGDALPGASSPVSLWAGLVLLLLVIGVSFLLLSAGAPLMWQADSAAHLAAIRGVVEEDRLFPIAQPYGPNGVQGADPRFGMFHGLCAVLMHSSGIEVHRLWAILPSFFAPMLVLGFFLAARCITGSVGAALLAAVLFPVCYGGMGGEGLRVSGYPNRVSMLVYLVCLGVAFVYLRRRQGWLLVLLGVLAVSAASVHVYYFIEFVFVMTCYFLLRIAVNWKQMMEAMGDWVRVVGVALGFSFPLLLYRFLTSFSTANVYAVEGQGILFLSGGLYILDPFRAYSWLGYVGAASVVVLPYFLWKAKRSESHAFVGAATAGPLALVFNPVLMPLASRFLSYLTSRLIWAVPYSLAAAMFLLEAPGRAKVASRPKKLTYAVSCGLIVLALAGTLNQRIGFYRRASVGSDRPFPQDLAGIADVVGRFDTLARERSVFLSDPITAYAIPAFSKHYVTAIPVAHSSPADPHPVSRIRDAMDVLNPGVGIAKTVSILREYGVDFVVVNTSFAERLFAFEYEVDPAYQSRALEKLSSATGLFQEVFSERGVHVFRVLNLPGQLPQADPPPTALVGGEASFEGTPIARFSELFSLEKVEFFEREVVQGDTLSMSFVWRCISELPDEDVYKLFVRLETPFPKGRFFSRAFEKPYRKVLEGKTHERFRFRVDVDPESLDYPLHLWRNGDVVRQDVRVPVPEDVCPGTYSVNVSLKRTTPGTNFSLSDYLRDEDYYSGVEVGTVLVRPGEGAAASRQPSR
jgi:hypothetical protein